MGVKEIVKNKNKGKSQPTNAQIKKVGIKNKSGYGK